LTEKIENKEAINSKEPYANYEITVTYYINYYLIGYSRLYATLR